MAKIPSIDLNDEIESICQEAGIDTQLSPLAVDAAQSLNQPDLSAEIASGRRDLRNLPLITIDGADAKDFDDAVHCQQDHDGSYQLTVAIADVSHYVRAGDDLDNDAAQRATSVYFPGKVFPMLPPKLSEDWCSLVPNQDRLALAAQLSISADKGVVTKYKFFNCVMRSCRRLTYIQAEREFEKGSDDAQTAESLKALANLTRMLMKVRRERGGLLLDLKSKSLNVKNGEVTGFVSEQRNFAHCVIEECMLAANTSAAAFLDKNKYPFLYRVHDKPDSVKAKRFQMIMREFHFKLRNLSNSKHLQEAIDAIAKMPPLVRHALNMNVLRTLQRAVYTPKNVAHYGLGYDQYAHFTSPIRRYPDLLVHRAIKSVIKGKKADPELGQRLHEIGMSCSEKEVVAERAGLELSSRIFNKMQQDKVGQTMQGAITGIARSGIFVACDDGLEGMVRFAKLRDDYYEVDQHQTRAAGKRTKRNLYIGMVVTVKLEDVDLEKGRCEMVLVD